MWHIRNRCRGRDQGLLRSPGGGPGDARWRRASTRESRLSHVRRLREGGIDAEVMLLRMPAMSEVDEVVALTQVSLNPEVETVRAIATCLRALPQPPGGSHGRDGRSPRGGDARAGKRRGAADSVSAWH